MGLWSAIQLAQSFLKVSPAKSSREWTLKLLRRSGVSQVLTALLITLLLLLATTSSFYITYTAASEGPRSFVVQVSKDGMPFLAPVEMGSHDDLVARLFLFGEAPGPLVLTISTPPGYTPIERDISQSSSVQIRVPDDFPPKRFYSLLILPGMMLRNRIPHIADTPHQMYSLMMEINGVSYEITDVRWRPYYLGVKEDDLHIAMEMLPRAYIADTLNDYLRSIAFPADRRPDVVATWLNNCEPFAGFELKPHDSLRLSIRRDPEGELLASRQHVIHERDSTVIVVILEGIAP